MKRKMLSTVEIAAAVIRTERLSQGLTRVQLAQRAGVTTPFVKGLEAGEGYGMHAKVLDVCEALGIHATGIPAVPSPIRLADVDLDAAMDRFA